MYLRPYRTLSAAYNACVSDDSNAASEILVLHETSKSEQICSVRSITHAQCVHYAAIFIIISALKEANGSIKNIDKFVNINHSQMLVNIRGFGEDANSPGRV